MASVNVGVFGLVHSMEICGFQNVDVGSSKRQSRYKSDS